MKSEGRKETGSESCYGCNVGTMLEGVWCGEKRDTARRQGDKE